jgi:hypothetical protein
MLPCPGGIHHATSHASSEPCTADGAAIGAGCAGWGARVCEDRSATDHCGDTTACAVSDLYLAARLSSLDRRRIRMGAGRMGASAVRSWGLGAGPVGPRAPRVLLAVGTLAAGLGWLVHHEGTKTRRILKGLRDLRDLRGFVTRAVSKLFLSCISAGRCATPCHPSSRT